MAGSKKDKRIRQKEVPKGKSIAQGGDPEQYYSQNPAINVEELHKSDHQTDERRFSHGC